MSACSRSHSSERARIALVIAAWITFAGIGLAADTPIPLEEARAAFAEARAASAADAGRIWGVPVYGPMLLVDRQTRFVVANRADEEDLLSEEGGVYFGRLPRSEDVANTAYEWAGVKWTMLIWPLPENRYQRCKLMLHECFHRIQDGLGLPGGNPANGHLSGEPGRVWLRLEFRALAEALIRSGEERRRAVADALVFRAHRRELCGEKAETEENALEMNEGLAEYTGFRMSGWPDAILADRAAVELEQADSNDKFVRSFAYDSGPAYGVLLDESGAAWREGLSPQSDFGVLLAQAMRIDLPEITSAEAERRAAAYDGDRVIVQEKARAARHAQVIAQCRGRFIDSPVLIVPTGEQLRYTFNPNTVTALGELGTVYQKTRFTAEWGVLEVTGGILVTYNERGAFADGRVPAPPEAPGGTTITGDGWKLTLNDGWKVAPGPREGDFRVVPN